MDIVTNGKLAYLILKQGSLKRCGGIGDVLSGLTGLYCFWARNSSENKGSSDDLLLGCILSCLVTRKAASLGYEKHKYSLTCPNVIENIGRSFDELFSSLEQSKL